MERCMLPHCHFYKNLHKVSNSKNKKALKNLLKSAKQKEIKSLCECTLNVVNGNIPITQHRLKTLKRFKKPLLGFVKNKTLKSKRNYIVQNGKGFLPIIASIATSLISQLLNK